MKCHLCPKEGTIFFTHFVDDKLQQLCYCHSCALKQGMLNTEHNSSEKAFFEEPDPLEDLPFAQSLLECPVCGFTLDNWNSIHKLGCSRCYDVFAPDVERYIAKFQAGQKHIGKVPVVKILNEQSKRRAKLLKSLLEEAVQSEEYEEAARIRDEIARLPYIN